MKKNKKGDMTEFLTIIIYDMIILVVLLVAGIKYIKTIETGSYFEKDFMSKDIALLLDTIYSNPIAKSEDQIYYNPCFGKLSEFNISFKNNKVIVSDYLNTKYYYIDNKYFRSDLGNLTSPEEIVFNVQDNYIKIANTLSKELIKPRPKGNFKFAESIVEIAPIKLDDKGLDIYLVATNLKDLFGSNIIILPKSKYDKPDKVRNEITKEADFILFIAGTSERGVQIIKKNGLESIVDKDFANLLDYEMQKLSVGHTVSSQDYGFMDIGRPAILIKINHNLINSELSKIIKAISNALEDLR
jgi:hypothetical protein